MTWMKRTLTIAILALTFISTGYAQPEDNGGDMRSADDKKWDLEIETSAAKTPAQIRATFNLLHAEVMVNRKHIEDLHQLIDMLQEEIDVLKELMNKLFGPTGPSMREAGIFTAAMQEIDTRLASLQWQINALRVGPIYRIPMKPGWESWSE